jgi:hypothetical protein
VFERCNELDEQSSSVQNKIPVDDQIDILEQGGIESVDNEDKTKLNRFTCPQRILEDEMFSLLRKLNSEQKQFVMHVLNCFKTGKTPLKVFLSGSAGVGKSRYGHQHHLPADNSLCTSIIIYLVVKKVTYTFCCVLRREKPHF